MYFSKIKLQLADLSPAMINKLPLSGCYASHQWLWQLFPEQTKRSFLFREEQNEQIKSFYVLSTTQPDLNHNLFRVQTKPFDPVLTNGMLLSYSLRANPVISRQGKRFDVLMNAKYLAKQNGIDKKMIWQHQEQAAKQWLIRQGENHGFAISEEYDGSCFISAYQQHCLKKNDGLKPIQFSSVDYNGVLRITDLEKFSNALKSGIGKSKSLGCGLLLIKRV